MTQHIAIIGGGITGLATAYYLQTEIIRKRLPLRFTVVEASSRWGGLVETVRKDGFIVEKGPDSFLERKKVATQLCMDLGLKDELVNNQVGQAYIYHDQQLCAVPSDSVMGIPTNLTSFLKTEFISTEGKARGLEDLIRSPKLVQDDQSVGAFFRHRFGDEMVDRMIEPLISGVYGSSIEDLSLEATFPQYPKLLSRYGSLIKALTKTRAATPSNQGMFQTLKSGLATMVEKIVESLPANTLKTNLTLTKLVKTDEGYELYFHNGERMLAQMVVLTIPYPQVKRILQPHLEHKQFNQSKPSSVAIVALAFDEDAIDIPFAGTGFLVPRGSLLSLTACTWVHKKWPHTVPAGKGLLRCFVGRPGTDEIVDASDDEIVEIVIRDLQQIQGIQIRQDPRFVIVNRMKNVRPTYAVGHKRWVKDVFQQIEKYFPKVYLAGSSYQGIGLPDCIKQGREVVATIVDFFTKKKEVAIH